jgi:hypothetical protein
MSTEGPSEDQGTLEYLRVRSRAHAPSAAATEQWESPPPEERTARTPRYHGVHEADQGMRRLSNTVNPKAVESASSWRGQPRDALEQRQAELMEPPRTKAPSRFYPGRPDHAALLGAARQVVEERRLTDAGFTPHGKRAGAGARRIEQSVNHCAVLVRSRTEGDGG